MQITRYLLKSKTFDAVLARIKKKTHCLYGCIVIVKGPGGSLSLVFQN